MIDSDSRYFSQTFQVRLRVFCSVMLCDVRCGEMKVGRGGKERKGKNVFVFRSILSVPL